MSEHLGSLWNLQINYSNFTVSPNRINVKRLGVCICIYVLYDLNTRLIEE